MRGLDRSRAESMILDLLMARKTRHEVASWARESVKRRGIPDDPVLFEVLEMLGKADETTGNVNRPHRVTEDALRTWLHRLKGSA